MNNITTEHDQMASAVTQRRFMAYVSGMERLNGRVRTQDRKKGERLS